MEKEDFRLVHNKEKLFAVITVEGKIFELDVTEYFGKHNPHDEWLDYRLGLKMMAEESKLTRKETK